MFNLLLVLLVLRLEPKDLVDVQQFTLELGERDLLVLGLLNLPDVWELVDNIGLLVLIPVVLVKASFEIAEVWLEIYENVPWD